jgi:hypothetical protein
MKIAVAVLHLEAVQERVLVFQRKFHIAKDVTMAPSETRNVVRASV